MNTLVFVLQFYVTAFRSVSEKFLTIACIIISAVFLDYGHGDAFVKLSVVNFSGPDYFTVYLRSRFSDDRCFGSRNIGLRFCLFVSTSAK